MLAVTAGSEQITRAMQALEAAFLIGVEGVTETWLVRHADCYQNITDALIHRSAHLVATRRGGLLHCQTCEAGRGLLEPAATCNETARAISDDVHVDDRLVEMDLVVNDDGSLDLREPPADVVERMRTAIDEIGERHPGQRIVVVSHGAAIIAYLTDVLRLELGGLRMLPYYTSISVVRALGDRRMVGALGDVAHLE